MQNQASRNGRTPVRRSGVRLRRTPSRTTVGETGPRVEFALLVILLMWASHSRVSLRQTPRYGVDETFSNVSPFRVY